MKSNGILIVPQVPLSPLFSKHSETGLPVFLCVRCAFARVRSVRRRVLQRAQLLRGPPRFARRLARRFRRLGFVVVASVVAADGRLVVVAVAGCSLVVACCSLRRYATLRSVGSPLSAVTIALVAR